MQRRIPTMARSGGNTVTESMEFLTPYSKNFKLPQVMSYTLLTSLPHPRNEWCQHLDQAQNTH